MSLLWFPLAAMAGALAGTIAHEASHYLVARALGEIVDVGWAGGVNGGPFVDFRVESRWRSECVRKAPLASGILAAVALAVSFDGLTLTWMAGAGFVAGLLWLSPADLFVSSAAEQATSA